MQVFTYSEARQNLAKLLTLANHEEEVQIRRRDGSVYTLQAKKMHKSSPFAVAGVKTGATTNDILETIAASRAQYEISEDTL